MLVESEATRDDDPEVVKVVEAADESEALLLARRLVQKDNPEINAAKIWHWSVARSRNA